MNLAYIIGTYPLLTTTFIEREIETLREMGMHVQILSIRQPPSEALQVEKYREMHRQITYMLPIRWLRLVRAHLFYAVLRPITYFTLLVYLITRPHRDLRARFKTLLHFGQGVLAAFLMRRSGAQHVHAHFIDRAATVALCVGRLLKLPYSLTAHATDIYTDPVLVYEKLAESKFTVTVSEFNKNHLLKQYPRLRPDRIVVLHPWVNLARFTPPATRPAHDRLRILSVGRLVEKKGHPVLIEACHQLQRAGVDFECWILGEGPLKPHLETLVTRYGLTERVHLLGGRPQAEVLARLGEMDVFVLACVVAQSGDRDGMPVALAEAMAMEVPVISTAIVGIEEMVRPGAGLLVPSNDASALAKAIESLCIAGPRKRAAMGRLGRTIIAGEFDLHTGVGRLAELFQQPAQSLSPEARSRQAKSAQMKEQSV